MLANPPSEDSSSLSVTLRWLWPFWKPLFPRLVFLLLATPLVVIFDAYVPMIIRQIVDGLSQHNLQPEWLWQKTLLILGLGLAHFRILCFGSEHTGSHQFWL